MIAFLALALAGTPDPVALELTHRAGLRGAPPLAAYARRVAADVWAAARESHLHPATVLAVAEVESGYDLAAESNRGCGGLMQLRRGTAAATSARYGIPPYANVRLGARYLRELLGLYSGRLPWALSAYNRGPARFARQGRPVGRYARGVLARRRVILRDLGN